MRKNWHLSNGDRLIDLEARNLEILSWISDDDEYPDSDCDSSVESHHTIHFSDQNDEILNHGSDFRGLELIPPDLTVIIFQHLTIQELSSVSQVSKLLFTASRNPDLWRSKFHSRWNFRIAAEGVDWFRSYVRAHRNCHDLWLTHWNIVYPCDSLSPGRCCIKREKAISGTRKNKITMSPEKLSPFYRFGDAKDGFMIPDVVETRAQAVATATALRLHHSDVRITQYSTPRARQAFSKSSTLNRRIATRQFEVQSLSFLTDVLFFNVHSDHDELEKLEEWLSRSELQDKEDITKCLHSWHVVHFSNPDFNKPMKWRVAAQRPEYFTVYPSEGYLLPGETCSVVFGVTPVLSLLVQSNYQLGSKPSNDACDRKFNEYLARAIPPTPFQVQYQYVTPIPCNMFQNSCGYHSSISHFNLGPKLRSVWDDLSASHLGIRTVHLAAHVHSSFPLYEFRRHTLVPFDNHSSCQRLSVFCTPHLKRSDPAQQEEAENLSMESKSSALGKLCRTDGPCKASGVFWGERFEELANAYYVEKVLCEIQKDRGNEKAKISGELLKLLVDGKKKGSLSGQSIRSAYQIICQKIMVEFHEARWLSRRQMQVVTEWKSAIGLIRNDMALDEFPFSGEPKPVPGEAINSKHVSRFLAMAPELQQRSFMQEFQTNSMYGVHLAAHILHDPRILQSFGAYERIRYPGTLCRRSQIPSLPKLNVSDVPIPSMKLKALICSNRKLTYYRSQNALDMDALCLVDSFCRHHSANHRSSVFPKPEFLGCTDLPDTDEISVKTSEIEGRSNTPNSHAQIASETRVAQAQLRDDAALPEFQFRAERNAGRRRVPRLLRVFIYLSTRLGLFVDNERTVSQCFIDRQILVSIHWVSISLTFLPLLSTLFARFFMLMPSIPVDYSLEGIPFNSENKLRYLTEKECGYAAFSVAIVCMVLGRWTERFTRRSYLRVMLEHQLANYRSRNCLSVASVWDGVCPIFLQRMFLVAPTFSPSDVTRHAAFWRSQISVESESIFDASMGHSPALLTFGEAKMNIGVESSGQKAFLGILVAIGTFWTSSPHMGLNALSIFMNGLSFGVSFSLQSVEVGRDELTYRRTGSFLKAFNIVSLMLLSSLVGQMVGSSGGILFLAEFIVTSVSLLLGGAGTMSVDTMQSWFTFIFYSSFAALGYAIGRAGIVQGTRCKKRCLSSILLCASMILAPFSWWIMAIYTPWEFPVPLIVNRPATMDAFSSKDLQ